MAWIHRVTWVIGVRPYLRLAARPVRFSHGGIPRGGGVLNRLPCSRDGYRCQWAVRGLVGVENQALSNEFITLSGMSDTLCWVLERKICGRQSYRMLYGTQSLRDESVSFQDTSFRCVLDTTQSPCSADFQSTWLLQVTALRIVGRALYPPFNFLLEDGFQMTQTLPRMRIHMGMCTAFCFFGTARLLGNWGVIQASTTGAESFEDSKVGSVTGGLSAAVTPFGIKTTEPQPTKFALFAVCNN